MDAVCLPVTSENNIYDKASWISKLYFAWVVVPLWKSFKGYDVAQMYGNSIPRDIRADQMENKIKTKLKKNSRLEWILCRVFFKDIFLAAFLMLCKQCGTNLLQIVLMKYLLNTLNLSSSVDSYAFLHYGTVVLYVIVVAFSSFFSVHSTIKGEMVGAKLRIAASVVVFKKLLKISTAQMRKMNVGKLINIFANDVAKFEENAKQACVRYLEPISIVALITYMYFNIGTIGLIGIAVIFAIGLPTYSFSRIFKKIGKDRAHLIDARLKLTREAITEARTLKLFCWENVYLKSIFQIRNKELKLCLYNCLCKTIYYTFSNIASITGLYVVLCVKSWQKEHFSAAQVYQCFANLNLIQILGIRVLNRTIENTVYAWVAIKRIEKILKLDEIPPFPECNLKQLVVKKVTSSWDDTLNIENERFCLKDIDLIFPKSAVTVVTGPVGGGKSTLLLTMANELYIHRGEVRMGGSFTYLPQEPWLFPASIRQNILFGLPYDELRYEKVLSSCALIQDLAQFSNRDSSNVDDKGLTLSGGQKSRIALARAMYRDSDVYLLDDPLSAVDPKVGKHIWKHCFQRTNKTIVLVSHNIQCLDDNSSVIYMDNGKAVFGNYINLKKQLCASIISTVDEVAEENCANMEKSDCQKYKCENTLSVIEFQQSSVNSVLLYWKMASAVCNGWAPLLLILFLSVLVQATNVFFNIYLVHYVDAEIHNVLNVATKYPLSILAYSIIAETILRLVQYFVYFYLCVCASRNIHQQLLNSVINTDVNFFDTHSTGQILSRFSKDLEIIDELLPALQSETLAVGFMIAGALVLTCYTNVIAIAPICGALILLFVCLMIYQKAVKSLKKKETSARCPTYTYMNCTVNGIAVIRSNENQKRVIEEFNQRVDQHSAVWFLLKGFGYGFSFACDVLGAVVTSSVVVVTVLVPSLSNSSRLGMGIACTISFAIYLNLFARCYTDSVHLLHSVDHLYKYMQLPSEDDSQKSKKLQSKVLWPQFGHILFKNISLKYVRGNVNALRNLSFEIRPQEKIGIVGRTGAGKTSLVTALFRLADTEGKIEIDGVDIKSLSLSTYRKKLSIIPQNPVILSGSLRHNLDPQGEYSDEELWSALESVQLKDEVIKMEFGLDDGMGQLSVGQKQLFCLARTLLHKNKIIVLDEATSNVDNNTDKIIQQLIRTQFSTSTILIIAHRLQTVLDLDRIMVMQNGEIVEFDTVPKLLSKPSGVFKSMIESSDCLRK